MTANTALIGVPHNNNITFPFFSSFIDLLNYEISQGPEQRLVGWLHNQGCYIHKNRNYICSKFLDTPAQYLWFVDTDIQFGPDYLQKLCAKAEELDADVLASPYLLLDGSVTFYSELNPGRYTSFGELESDAVYDLDAAGTGNMLIHRRVLTNLRDNFEGWHRGRSSTQDFPAAWFAYDMAGGTVLGEDYTFCRRAKKQGFSIKGWVGSLGNHWKLQPVSPPPPPEPHPADLTQETVESTDPEEEPSGIIIP
jgi:hypothetical protein